MIPRSSRPLTSRTNTTGAEAERLASVHPKLYLRYLLDPVDFYRETVQGVAALRSLAWTEVLAPEEFVKFGRSFISDLADALSVGPRVAGAEHPLTSRNTHRNPHVLRNL